VRRNTADDDSVTAVIIICIIICTFIKVTVIAISVSSASASATSCNAIFSTGDIWVIDVGTVKRRNFGGGRRSRICGFFINETKRSIAIVICVWECREVSRNVMLCHCERVVSSAGQKIPHCKGAAAARFRRRKGNQLVLV
jgi:hypothetical protein